MLLGIHSGLDEEKIKKLLSHIYLPLNQKVSLFGSKKKVIVIAGPTGTGKTALSLKIAKAIKGEILSADSMQVYTGMDIGTAKIKQDEMGQIPHHMIDIVDIDYTFNVVQYFERAQKIIEEIFLRGNVPIIVGGSGFYIHALLFGPPEGPSSDPDIRKRLEEQMASLGSESLFEQLQMLDPKYADSITEKDKHKIIRALEIIALTGRSVSNISRPTEMRNDQYNFRLWFIYYEKEVLYPKIEMRCDQMIEKGFIEEVKSLQKKGLEKNRTASNAIGYKQCLEFLKSDQTKEDYLAFVYNFKKVSRNYAKRQFTWFRKEPFFCWMNLIEMSLEHLQEIILQDFEQS